MLEQDPALCYAYATGDALRILQNRIPAEVLDREIALNERVLRTARDRPAIEDSDAERIWGVVREAMRSSLTVGQFEAFTSNSDVVPEQYADYCAASIALFREIATMPERDGATAMRVLFQAQ